MTDLAITLAENAAKTTYDMLPREAVDITKKFILDTLACQVAGTNAPGCKSLVEQVKDWGGKEESTILGFGGKVIAPHAALANSMMMHALDFDDTHDQAGVHANASVLPAAMAMAERSGTATGKDLINAVNAGVDIMSRIGMATLGPPDFILSSTAAYFGAAVAAGKILGLDAAKLGHAMGIAYSQCGGSGQCLVDGAIVKRMQPGFGAKTGVIAAILAGRGFTGAVNTLEGPFGFYKLYHGNNYDRQLALKALGETFGMQELSVKLYPCCRYTHAPVDAALGLRKENNINLDDVSDVTVHITQGAFNFTGKPFEIRDNPQVDAQFSIAYTVAAAVARGTIGMATFRVDNIKGDAEVLALARKVKIVVDQENIRKGITPCVVDIKMKNGKLHTRRTDVLRGDPRNPVDMAVIADKFRSCAKLALKPMPPKNVEKVIDLVSHLEDQKNLIGIVTLLT